MDELEQTALKQRFQAAVDAFVDKIKGDPNVIAVIVAGSLAYDVVWEKSDVDTTVVVRDQLLKADSLSIVEDGIILNVHLMPRSKFKRGMERAIGGSFFQTYLANGKIVYSNDESLYEYFEEIKEIGTDDRALSAMYLAGELIGTLHKVEKWLTARKDTLYAQYFLLHAAENIAHMELCVRGIPTSRSAIQKALVLNPEMMERFYQEPMERRLTEEELWSGLRRLDRYLEEKMELFQKPVIEYLSSEEIKTMAMIAEQFGTDSHFLINVLDYLAEKGAIARVAQTIKLTPKSRLGVEEIGYMNLV